MSSTDKTRQQLVDSMRKTKAAAAGKKSPGDQAPRPPARVAKTTKKAASSTPAKPSTKGKVGSRAETPDLYQMGRRVWPD